MRQVKYISSFTLELTESAVNEFLKTIATVSFDVVTDLMRIEIKDAGYLWIATVEYTMIG